MKILFWRSPGPWSEPYMLKVLSIAFLCASLSPAIAQSLVTISPDQCVWHAGDHPAGAAPNRDETGWQSFARLKLMDQLHFWQSDQPHFWARCHADLSSLRTL